MTLFALILLVVIFYGICIRGNGDVRQKETDSCKKTVYLDACKSGRAKKSLANMSDAQIDIHETISGIKVNLIYIKSLIDNERLNEAIVRPLIHDRSISVNEAIFSSTKVKLFTMDEATVSLLNGDIILYEVITNQWWAVPLPSSLSRSIESSETETILYGAKDSFSEQIDQNLTLIRRRLPIIELKNESFKVGSLSKTTVVLLYIDGLTNPEFITNAKEEINKIDFDFFQIHLKFLHLWKMGITVSSRNFSKRIDRMFVPEL